MRALRWVLVALVGLALCARVGEARGRGKTARPRGTALVGVVWGNRALDVLTVIAACSRTRGWVGSEEAKGLLHKSDHLSICGFHAGRVGEAVVMDEGALLSEGHAGPDFRGLEYTVRARLDPGAKSAGPLLATWHAPGSPDPLWVRAATLSTNHRTYLRLLARWLREHGRGDWAPGVQVRQILRADVNGDGRDDVLLSFDWVDRGVFPDRAKKRPQAYLLLRYLPRGSRTARTVVVTTRPSETLEVTGLCDLDRDGWLEVIVEDAGYEWGGTWLYHWTGAGFASVTGNLLGV